MRFDYFEPTSLVEAQEILAAGDGELKPFCGGTDILIQGRRGLAYYRGLVNLKRIPELSRWHSRGGALTIGACTPMRDLEVSHIVRERFSAFWESLRLIGSLQLRNLASVGGNLCNASPAADTAPALIALGATVSLSNGEAAEEVMAVESFFKGPGTSSLGPAGVLVSVTVPEWASSTGGAFERFTPRSAMDIAIASAAAQVSLDPGNARIEDVRIALGAVAPTPRRAPRAEAVLRGQAPTREVLAEAGRLARTEASPIDDIRASAAYRRELVCVLVKRVLQKAVARASAEERGHVVGGRV